LVSSGQYLWSVFSQKLTDNCNWML
jgi:hypothetical protein